jgi:lysozyme
MGPFSKCLNLSLYLLLTACASQPNDPLKASVQPDIMGVDISKYQGDVDFKQLKASGITYVFIRASEGNTYQDPKFESHFAQAKAAGLIVSAYHFYETNDAPNSQLDNFTQLVTLSMGDLPPVVDIERLHQQDDSQLSENLQVYLNGLESHYGVRAPLLIDCSLCVT